MCAIIKQKGEILDDGIYCYIFNCGFGALCNKKAPQEEVEKLPAQFAGFGIKMAAIIIAAVMSISPTKDLIRELEDFTEKTPTSWKMEYYAEDYEYYYDGRQLDKDEYDEKKKDLITDYIYEELKILALCLLLIGIGSIIQKRALANFELEKIRKAMSEKDNNYNTATTGNAAAKPPAFCSDCGSKLSGNYTFCPGCGKQCAAKTPTKPVPRIYATEPKPKLNKGDEWTCGDCGTKNSKTAVMCKGCGKFK